MRCPPQPTSPSPKGRYDDRGEAMSQTAECRRWTLQRSIQLGVSRDTILKPANGPLVVVGLRLKPTRHVRFKKF